MSDTTPALQDKSALPTVYNMPHEQQVQLLSDALLREFMHRRGFRATLKAFDGEHPRNADTIASRALMANLMALPAEEQKRLKADGIETIMEMLCALRVERRREKERLIVEAGVGVPTVPESYKKLIEREQRRRSTRVHDKGDAVLRESRTRRGHQEHRRHHTRDTTESRGNLVPSSGAVTVGAENMMTLDDLLGSSSSSSNSSGGPSPDAGGTKTQRRLPSEADKAEQGESRKGDGAPSRAQAVAAAASSHLREDVEESAGRGGGGSGEDTDSDATADGGQDVNASLTGGAPVTLEVARAVDRLVCGHELAPPMSFLRQGFTFDEVLPYALVQLRRGPGAILAAVQAFVVAYYFAKEVYVEVTVRQKDCLRRALCTILLQAQPDVARVVLVNGALNKADATISFTSHMASGAFRCWTHFDSAEAVAAQVERLLVTNWMAPKGCGLWCFLTSLVLSRGVDVVRTDMAAPRPLISTTKGDGTIELANLCLTGRALSYCHDGIETREDGTPLRGYTRPMLCGMLNGDAAGLRVARQGLSEFGPTPGEPASRPVHFAAEPQYASWVVSHAGHFSNLFMKKDTRKVFLQKRQLGGTATVELTYWDAATVDDEVTLSVSVGSTQWGGRQRNAVSYVNTAILNVPQWCNAVIDWNGDVPLRD